MITKTFICDCCKKSVGETELVTLSVSMKGLKAESGYAQTLMATKDVCRDCLEKKGILTVLPEGQKFEDVAAKSQKSLEDKFVDFLVDIGVMFEQ